MQTMQALTTSLILEGVFERFPKLRVLLMRKWNRAGWLPLGPWRARQALAPPVARGTASQDAPSEYFKRNIWFTTSSPSTSRNGRQDLRTIIDWVGRDPHPCSRPDYPHWGPSMTRATVFKGALDIKGGRPTSTATTLDQLLRTGLIIGENT